MTESGQELKYPVLGLGLAEKMKKNLDRIAGAETGEVVKGVTDRIEGIIGLVRSMSDNLSANLADEAQRVQKKGYLRPNTRNVYESFQGRGLGWDFGEMTREEGVLATTLALAIVNGTETRLIHGFGNQEQETEEIKRNPYYGLYKEGRAAAIEKGKRAPLSEAIGLKVGTSETRIGLLQDITLSSIIGSDDKKTREVKTTFGNDKYLIGIEGTDGMYSYFPAMYDYVIDYGTGDRRIGTLLSPGNVDINFPSLFRKTDSELSGQSGGQRLRDIVSPLLPK